MLSKSLEKALNAQVNAEFWSAYLYLSMSAHFTSNGLPGFANWMYVQYQEEVSHALKFFRYIQERGGKATLAAIEKVPTTWKSALNVFEDTLKHEQIVTGLINNLMDMAINEKDFATQSMLKWYIDEQVEEEANAQALIDSLKLINNDGYGLYSLDKELLTRIFTDATQASE